MIKYATIVQYSTDFHQEFYQSLDEDSFYVAETMRVNDVLISKDYYPISRTVASVSIPVDTSDMATTERIPDNMTMVKSRHYNRAHSYLLKSNDEDDILEHFNIWLSNQLGDGGQSAYYEWDETDCRSLGNKPKGKSCWCSTMEEFLIEDGYKLKAMSELGKYKVFETEVF